MLAGDVVGHEVEHDAQARRVGGVRQLAQVRLPPQARLDPSQVDRVVAVV